MNLLLTGATGFTGGEVLRQALASPAVDSVRVVGRRPLGRSHPKLREIVLRDFLDWSSVDLAGLDACIWALGASQTAVPRDEYVRITVDYAVAAARALFVASPKARFCFVSGRNADPTEQRGALNRRIKGRAERLLGELGGEVIVFRPAWIRPTRATGPRTDFGRWVTPIGVLTTFWNPPELVVDGDQLARCLLGVAASGDARKLLQNKEIRDWRAAA